MSITPSPRDVINVTSDVADNRLEYQIIGWGNRKPKWTELYRLGVELNRHMEPFATLEEVAKEIGVTKQNAYTETVLALGKLAYGVRACLAQRQKELA